VSEPAPPPSLPVLYLMCPVRLYDSPVLAAARKYPFETLTGCPVKLEVAADLYCCNKCWVASWPELRARIRFGVFLDHLDGWVARGTFAEVMELLGLGVPVWWLNEGQPVDCFKFGPANYRDWAGYYRRVTAATRGAVRDEAAKPPSRR
jgi:hypothetical protein